MGPIPYGKQHITEADIQAVATALASDYLTQGPQIKEFEDAFANYVGSKYAVAVSNGTAALHLSALALEVNPGDKVITTPITFAATANCIRYCGGQVVFADIDPETYLLDIKNVEKLLKSSPMGTYKGIIPVDFAGRPVDLYSFRQLADQYGLWIIEDACHAPGGFFKSSIGHSYSCGDGKLADLAIFSFHPVKHIACGEGGMVTTNNEKLYQKLINLRTHGITRDSAHFTNSMEFANGSAASSSYPNWYMEMQQLGFNYRITDFQCALGHSQLKRANIGLEKRRQIANRYQNAFKEINKIKGQSGVIEGHAYHLYIIEVDDRLGLYNALRKENIFAQVHYIPVHLMPYYQESGWREGDLPIAENYYKSCISLPMYPTLLEEEQNFVIEKILSFLND